MRIELNTRGSGIVKASLEAGHSTAGTNLHSVTVFICGLIMELEELMMGMVELPILYNALFPAANNNSPDFRSASELAIRASESFNKQAIISIHKADRAKFSSWLQDVDAITASKEKERKEEKLNGNVSPRKGLLLKLRESVVEIPPRPPAPLGILRPVRVSELQLDRQHYGLVLYGTLCVEAFKMTAVMTLLEEPSTGYVMKLAVYNAVPSTATLAEVQAQFPEGSRVAIKEPYFKRYKDHTVGLRVNNPGDVIFVDSSINAVSNERKNLTTGGPAEINLQQSNLRNYDELRLEGNRAFSTADWKGAVNFYTTSIGMALNSTSSWNLDSSTRALCEPSPHRDTSISKKLVIPQKETFKHRMEGVNCKQAVKPISKNSARKRSKRRGANSNCEQQEQQQWRSQTETDHVEIKADRKAESALLAAYSNRSEAWLRLHKYDEALVDAQNALTIDSTHVKSMFRKGRALHHLHQYSKAVQCLQSALAFSPNDADLVKALKESLTGDLQSRLGVYDLSSYYLGNSSGPPPPCADFVGPVKVQMLESKYGRGSGQRGLVVSKSVRAGDLLLVSNPLAVARAEGVSIEFHIIPATRRMNDASQEDLVTQLYNKARVSPTVLNQLHSLYRGKSRERAVEPSMELFILPGMNNAVEFEPRSGSLNNRSSCFIAAASNQQPDITKIRHIVQWNAFDEHGCATEGRRQRLRGFCSGIWLLPSFINHSCLPNVSRVHVGDAMMIYAARDLEAGDELCLPYFDILSPLPQRREKSLRGWGFVCKCPRCMLEEELYPEIKHLTDRFTHLEEDALPVAFQEQTAAGCVGVTKFSSSYVGYGFFRHAKQFLGLARDVEALLSTNRKLAQLTSQKKNWMRASYAIASIVGNSNVSPFDGHKVDSESRLHYLRPVLESLEEVFPGNPQTLSIATTFMDELRKQNGLKSQAFKNSEQRIICICRSIFGNQKVQVLWSLIRALQEGKMEV